jgi:hypothetical protein
MSRRDAYEGVKKLEVIQWIRDEGGGVANRAAKKFKIPPGTVRTWWANRSAIVEALPGELKRKRMSGGGRTGIMTDFDEEISDLILNLRAGKERVTRETVRHIALEIAKRENINEDEFKASDGWLTKFMERNRFSFRRVMNLALLSDETLLNRAFEYLKYLGNVRKMSVLSSTVLMDETAVYLEDPRRTTIDSTGMKHVLLKTTGFSSMRITVVLAVKGDGSKMTPLVISKGKDSLIQKKHGVWLVYQNKAWVNSELLISWMELIYPRVIGEMEGKLMVWDSCRAHISKAVKSYMASRKINWAIIPGGLTPYVQAGDIGIYKSFKDNLSPLIEAWKKSGSIELTRGGNPKPPKEETISDWVKLGWRNVPQSVVQKSIYRAGFHDDFEEWLITRHDIYGARFKDLWISNFAETVDNFDVEEEEVDDLFLLDGN